MAAGGYTPETPQWDTSSGKCKYSALGKRDVLMIVPAFSDHSQDVVPRRLREELSEDERRKLEHQGVPRDCHHDDLSIMKARHTLDQRMTVIEVMTGDTLTCELVRKTISKIINNTETVGVILYYIGPGKKGRGDWCFSDGFISFREIMDLYTVNKHFKGKVLTIISDCSYSGSWVKEAMTFMDEQGVGPCGHVAKEKGILIKVLASCQAHETPAELAFSTQCVRNDKNTGDTSYTIHLYGGIIQDGQHPSGIDFTEVQCKKKINQPCTMAPGSTWERWNIAERTMLAQGYNNRGSPVWHYVLLIDDEEKIIAYRDSTMGENAGKNRLNVGDYGQILKTGLDEDPPNDVKQWIQDQYLINYDYQHSSHTTD